MNSRQQEIVQLIENTLEAEAKQTDVDGMLDFIEAIGEMIGKRYHELKKEPEFKEPPQQPQQQAE